MATIINHIMVIELRNAVYPIDRYCSEAFLSIFNLLLLSGNVVELNHHLITRNLFMQGMWLSNYFKWIYKDDAFILWQRMEYGSELCFRESILELKYSTIMKDKAILN